MTEQSEPSTPPKPRLTQTARGQTIFVSLWVLGTLVTLGLWVGAFVLGQSVGAPEDAVVEEVVDVVEISTEFPELGPPSQTPGTWAWDELRGGECLTGFSDPFAEEFQVVSCSSLPTTLSCCMLNCSRVLPQSHIREIRRYWRLRGLRVMCETW